MTAPSRTRHDYPPEHLLAWTPRQVEVLDLLAKGRSNPQIAEELGVSLQGAKWHVREVMSKLGVDSRDGAADYWRQRNGLPARLQRSMRGIAAGLSLKWVAAAGAGIVVALGALAVIVALQNGGETEPVAPDETPTVQEGTPTAAPSPAATPTPGATGTPAPGVAAIERASGQWETLTFARGERIVLPNGIAFMDTETGEVMGYRAYPPDVQAFSAYIPSPGGRLVAAQSQELSTILNRETGEEWQWPPYQLFVVLLGDDFVVFAEATRQQAIWPPRSLDTLHATDASMQPLASFELPVLADQWPRREWVAGPGRTAFAADRQGVYRVDIETGDVEELYAPEPIENYDINVQRWDSRGDRLVATYRFDPTWGDSGPVDPTAEGFTRQVVLDPATGDIRGVHDSPTGNYAWAAFISPDGRYAVYDSNYHVGHVEEGFVDRIPYLTLVDLETGDPVWRMRSAGLGTGDFLVDNRWLPDSSGFLAAVAPGTPEANSRREMRHAIIWLDGQIELLPQGPVEGEWYGIAMNQAPVASPDDPDLFSFGRISLYNRATDEWVSPAIPEDGPDHTSPWGSESDEMRMAFPHGGHGGGGLGLLLNPVLEFPPFSDALDVVVAGSGTCLNLRAEPTVEGEVLGCLADGTVMTLTPTAEDIEYPPEGNFGGQVIYAGSIVAGRWTESSEFQYFAHVATPQGMGWVAIEYLAWAQP